MNQERICKFENGTLYRGKWWFTDNYLAELFCYDVHTEETQSFCCFEKEFVGKKLFGTIIPFDNELFLIPYCAEMYRVNLDTKKIVQVKLDSEIVGDLSTVRFSNGILANDTIWMVGYSRAVIVAYEIKNNRVNYYTEFVKELSVISECDDTSWFGKPCLFNDKVYVPVCRTNSVLSIDLNNYAIKISQIGKYGFGFSCVCNAEGYLWIVGRHKQIIYRWNPINGDVATYDCFPTGTVIKEYAYLNAVYWKKKIFLVPWSTNALCFLSETDNGISKLDINELQENEGYFNAFVDESIDSLVIVSSKNGNILIIDSSNQYRIKRILLPEDLLYKKTDAYRLLQKKEEHMPILIEEYKDALKDYLDYIKN